MKRIYRRESYLNKIRGFLHSDLIKVITGIRRCGKSSFMQTVRDELSAQGVSDQDMITIDLDRHGFRSISKPAQLEAAIGARIHGSGRKYIFIDEIQNVSGFEPVVNAYREDGHSIFITGSNSYLLSGELVTKLTGRYIEIEMFPLDFSEYMGMKRFLGRAVAANPQVEFRNYIREGGFPQALEFENEADREDYASEVVRQIMEKDIARTKIRNPALFERVKTYVINNYGATTSLVGIADYFAKTQQIKIKPETLRRYLDIMERAKIIYRCPRFDLKSKMALKGEEKYYLADLSIYFSQNTDARVNYGTSLENVLFCWLRSHRYRVSVGRIGRLECDFIVRRENEYAYIQSALSVADPDTEAREYRPFAAIRDNYPKYLFTLDPLANGRDGIIHRNLADWMADPDSELAELDR